jgi:hypothetical protein
MKLTKRIGGLTIIIGIIIGIILVENRGIVMRYYFMITSSITYILILALGIIIFGVVSYYLIVFGITKGKFKLLGLGKPFTEKTIPQEKRIQMVKDFAEKWWLTNSAISGEPDGHGLILVEIRTTPLVKGATQYETYYFTSDKTPLDRRIGYNYEIPKDKRFFFEINCMTGEINPILPDSATMNDAYQFSYFKFRDTIPKEIKETPFEKEVKKGMAEALGIKAVEKATEEGEIKEKIKEVEKE